MPNKETSAFSLGSTLVQPSTGGNTVRYRKNQIIFSQGELADAVF